ncbi:MAG TPA: T9SS type A sorting domain-containing protein [Bacteroidia bacterium]|nr:T9SS type A sorting domain-containing protein [Bacteroidia bacterium]
MRRSIFSGVVVLLTATTVFSQASWTQKTSLNGNARHRPFTFSIGSRGYLGCGWNGVTMYQDVWEYDPGTDSWTEKADYPSGPRLSAFGFSIGSKGYVGCGLDQYLYAQPDFYEYNPATNQWTAKAPFTGTPIFGAASAVANNKGYVFFGDDWDPNYWRHNEVYEYNPGTNSWAYAGACPSDGKRDPVAFTLNNKIYVGTGADNSYFDTGDWWEFNPSTYAWTPKATFAGSARSQAVGFAVMGKGYVGTGGQMDVQDFWQYDATADTWTETNSFPGQGRENAATFVIGNLAYFMCGTSGTNYADLWEFNPLNITGINEVGAQQNGATVFPDPVITTAILKLKSNDQSSENKFSLFDMDGKCVMRKNFTGAEFEINREGLSTGIYFYSVESEGKKVADGKLDVQ